MRSAWDLFREMEALRREIDGAFAHAGLGGRGPLFRFSFLPGQAARTYPLVNVSEDDENVYVEALAPGIDPDSLDVNVVSNQLTIAGEKKPLSESVKADAYHRNERAAGRFVRTLALPSTVASDGAKANYRNGILKLELPKPEEAKSKRISVQVA